jgi:predicted metal-dependent hydrolase
MSDVVSKTEVPLIQRKVEFDFSQSPLHWIPDDPFTSHFISVIHTILPAGEFFFCRLYNKALPLITNDKLKEDVKGFIRQEATHARAHDAGILEFLNQHQMDTSQVVSLVQWIFSSVLADKPFGLALPKSMERRWLVERLGFIAAVEHFTCVLGKYALENQSWDQAKADAVILDILRWHAAEEIEHRSVAFDVYRHVGGQYHMRYPQLLVAMLGIIGLWSWSAVRLMQQDSAFKDKKPALLGRYFWRTWQAKAKGNRLPSLLSLVVSGAAYLRRDYDPVLEADTQQALDYLSQSPAAIRATAAV